MNKAVLCCALIMFSFVNGLLRAAEPTLDPIANHLFPPELVMQYKEQIGFSQEQQERLHTTLQGMQKQFLEKEEKIKEAVRALDTKLKGDQTTEAEALLQFENVLNAERDIKRLQLSMLIRIKNILTQDQRRQLLPLKKKLQASKASAKTSQDQLGDIPQRMEKKLQRVKSGVEAKVADGEQPLEIVQLMEEFPKLMQEGNHKGAEKILDKALKLLEKTY